MLDPPGPWLVRRPGAPRGDGVVALVCLPYAGGGVNAYRGWHARLAPSIAVVAAQLPGRDMRLREPPIRRFEPLADALADAIVADLGDTSRVVLFGHSMGAALAFECARRLSARGRAPVAVIVSGRGPRTVTPPLHLATDAELVAALRAFGGTQAAVLDEPELLAMILPALRADFEVLATYRFVEAPRLAVPLLAVGGEDDPMAAPGELEAWRDATTGPFAVERFPGGHFYFAEPTRLLETIARAARSP